MAGRGSRVRRLGSATVDFCCGAPGGGLERVLRHVGRLVLVGTHLSCIDLKGVLDYALLG